MCNTTPRAMHARGDWHGWDFGRQYFMIALQHDAIIAAMNHESIRGAPLAASSYKCGMSMHIFN